MTEVELLEEISGKLDGLNALATNMDNIAQSINFAAYFTIGLLIGIGMVIILAVMLNDL